MSFSYYLNHICFCGLLKCDCGLVRPLSGMYIKKFDSDNPGADNIMICNVAGCADKRDGWPSRFPITGRYKLVF